jgi:hypothetical protein
LEQFRLRPNGRHWTYLFDQLVGAQQNDSVIAVESSEIAFCELIC